MFNHNWFHDQMGLFFLLFVGGSRNICKYMLSLLG